MKLATNLRLSIFAIGVTATLTPAMVSAQQIEGQVLGAGAPIANARITLFAATADTPAQLSQTQSGPDGHFTLPSTRVPGGEIILYLIAAGGEPAANRGGGNNPNIALLAVLGPNPAAKVIINEMTTIASLLSLWRSVRPRRQLDLQFCCADTRPAMSVRVAMIARTEMHKFGGSFTEVSLCFNV